MTAELHLVLPGKLDQKTGGYLYDAHIVAGLRARGVQVHVHSLPGSYPLVDQEAIVEADRVLADLPDGALVVIDGLALPGVAGSLMVENHRLRLAALVHHPLSLEMGLSEAQARTLQLIEQGSLARVQRVIVTSPATAETLLADFHVTPDWLGVVEPGTDRPERLERSAAAGSGTDQLNLLCVATVTPRKGHLILVEALSRLADLPWRLTCIGSTTRDAGAAAAVQDAIARHGLTGRITLMDEIEPEALRNQYRDADLFVLPSYYEGYGMALAEALSHGLPIVSSKAGAIPTTVPADAGILVHPGDVGALTEALRSILTDAELRSRLTTAACAAALKLPTWDDAVDRFAAELVGMEPTLRGSLAGA
jgi:glycosyltransferase involved in cell wall biosynthesis